MVIVHAFGTALLCGGVFGIGWLSVDVQGVLERRCAERHAED